MADSIDVSVVIPARDAALTLRDQLDGLANQTYGGSWEVIVADNGSTDETVQEARRFADRLPLRVIDASARKGPGAARNIGTEVANGQMIVFCDADDVVASGWLDGHVRSLSRARLSTGPTQYFVGETAPTAEDIPDRGPMHFLGSTPFASTNNLGVRRTTMEELGGFRESLHHGEDIDLCLRASVRGYHLGWDPEAAVRVRQRTALSSVARQFFAYGRSEVTVYRLHRDTAVPVVPIRRMLWPSVLVLATLPRLLSRSRRRSWVQSASRHVGRLVGSIENRTLLL